MIDRERLVDIIIKVAMAHHDDISKQDEDAAGNAADEILELEGRQNEMHGL